MRYLLTISLSFVPLIILGQELLVNVTSTSKGDSISSPSTQYTYIKKKGKIAGVHIDNWDMHSFSGEILLIYRMHSGTD